jgi:hypothetical protein
MTEERGSALKQLKRQVILNNCPKVVGQQKDSWSKIMMLESFAG